MTTAQLIEYYCHQAEAAHWQQGLRQSVRLHLALSEPGVSKRQVRAALLLLEDELRHYLVASYPSLAPLPKAASAAAIVLHTQQRGLLSHQATPEQLRRELSVAEFMPTLGKTCHPHQLSADGLSWAA